MGKFLKGAAILSIAGILVKIMGAFFRIPLTNWVGADGLSYYSSAYMVYSVLLVISTAGIPIAVSRMVAERVALNDYYSAKRLFKVALIGLSLLGAISFVLMYFCSDFIASVLVANPGASLSIKALAPAVLIVPIMSAFRGYFQGMQNMVPTAASQFFEQLGRVVVGLFLAHKFLSIDHMTVSAGATFGCSAGAIFGLITLIIIYFINSKAINNQIELNKDNSYYQPLKELIKEMLVITIPITIGSCIIPIISASDSVIVMRRLQATGWSYEEAKLLWGRLGGYCDSIINLPSVLITGITASVLPLIATSIRLKKLDEAKENSESAIKLVMMISSPCAAGLFALSYPILKMLYPNPNIAQEVQDAIPTLRILCFTVILGALTSSLGAILQAIGKQTRNLINMLVGYIFKILCSIFLVGIAAININGAPIGSIICELVIIILDIGVLRDTLNFKLKWSSTIIKPVISSLIMGILAFLTYTLLFNITDSIIVSTLVSVIVGVISYAILILLTKTINKKVLLAMPKGEKIVQKLDRFLE